MARFYIGDRVFKSKKAVEDACRAILYKNQITDEDKKFLYDLLQGHRSCAQKIGVGIADFYVSGNDFGNKCFWIRRIDGTTTDFSFLRCITPLTPEQEGLKALRHTISEQVKSFKARAFGTAQAVSCAISGACLTWDDAHVDHAFPKTFDFLAEVFALSEGITYGDIKVKPTVDGVMHIEMVDTGLRDRWLSYHAKHAELRLVSKKLNMSMGSRGSR